MMIGKKVTFWDGDEITGTVLGQVERGGVQYYVVNTDLFGAMEVKCAEAREARPAPRRFAPEAREALAFAAERAKGFGYKQTEALFRELAEN